MSTSVEISVHRKFPELVHLRYDVQRGLVSPVPGINLLANQMDMSTHMLKTNVSTPSDQKFTDL